MIKVLDKFIADKIAAGEVIERPVSAVKELTENSIDAGASSIIVEIRGGGKSYIRITDDGSGIPQDQTETAFLRHATSKISGITDLDNISTLGFRGEALASIAAVSKLTMVTRTHDDPAGTRMMLHGGKVISKETAGANPGTTIVVEDIFYNTPARRKFMGSDAREAAAIIDLIEQYAVCYSNIRFMMIRNGETVFTTPGDGDTLSVIQKLYPDTAHARLIPVEGNNVHGFVSDPGTTKNNRKGQIFFVNGRVVSSNVIEKGIEKGYGGRVFSGFPIAVLFIDADPSTIDVNIHPGKREIRFLRSDEVISDIASAIDSAMQTRGSIPAGIIPSAPEVPQEVFASPFPARKPEHADQDKIHDEINNGAEYISERTISNGEERSGSSGSPYPEVVREPAPDFTGEQSSIRDFLGSIDRTAKTSEPQSSAPDRRDAGIYRPFSFDGLRLKGYVFDTYIIMESEDSIYMFDQHAAHERIYYEKFTQAYLSSEQLPQPVLTPITINVSADVYYIGREMLEPLHRMGYDIQDFGAGSFIIRGLPAYVSHTEAVDFVRSYLESAGESSDRHSIVIDKLIMKSCKSAIKGGEKLSEGEILDLMKELAECSNPYACPHGRPTFIRYTKYEIERSFRRK